jgi:hypothetical protein
VSTTNGSPPGLRPPGAALSRRVRLLIGGAAALIIAAVLIAPIVLLTGSGTQTEPCTQALRFQDHEYVARHVVAAGLVQGIAIGIGVTSRCGGSAPANVNLRSLRGVKPTVAVGIPADQSSIYVRRGVCTRSSPRELLGCLANRR